MIAASPCWRQAYLLRPSIHLGFGRNHHYCNDRIGLGWDDIDVENGDLLRVSKNGGGWGSQLTFFPKSEYCVILLQNSQRGNLIKAAIDIESRLTAK